MDKIENCKWRICDRLGNDSLTTCYCTHPKMHFKEGKEFIAVNCDHTAECHRFEPKPVVATVLCPCVRGESCPIHPKPDEGRLLTEKELDILAAEYPLLDFSFEDDYREEVAIMRMRQDAKTAEIKDREWAAIRALDCDQHRKECQARIEALIEEIEKRSYPEDEGLEFYFTDEDWEALKATHTSKGDEG